MKQDNHAATPGPWEVHEHFHADGEYWASIGHAGRGPIADIVGAEGNHTRFFQPAAGFKYLVTPVDEQKANARLIAAAPSLLEALENLTVIWRQNNGSVVIGPVEWEQAQVAIAKAKGD